MEPDQQLRNLRDFLLVYNRMTEVCFQRCTSNFNYRNLTMDEERCVDSCAGKLIRSNHRLMSTYVQLMPRMVQRRMEEMETKVKAAEEAAAAAAATPAAVGTVTTEASPALQTPITSSPPPEVLPLLSPSVTDAAAEVHGSVLKPVGLDIPAELDAAVPKATTAIDVKLSAAAALTPTTETVNPSVLNNTGNGPLYTAGFPQPPTPAAQIDSGSPAPVFMPPKPTSLSEDVALSSVAPTVSKSESLSSQEKPSQVPPLSGQ
ncbi:mitochondrial import inner membrane translocase subunit Tim10 B [Stegastes partitus]|uniref:Mitochondrial import inner membrane translocase subunit Tim10 B n=1 Tax=Stegastes partitus TaxID=144197 RepID=A0A3B4ZV72_9TELE|nr:PREDICTED: mitochondrial import inner membrane translocase subunit Tim10 B [Stegastes partitus]